MSKAIGGVAEVRANGKRLRVVGDWTYNTGKPMREPVVGLENYGYIEKPQTPYIAGKAVGGDGFNPEEIKDITDGTVVLELKTGDVMTLSGAYFAGEGEGSTEKGEFDVRFEGTKAKFVPAP